MFFSVYNGFGGIVVNRPYDMDTGGRVWHSTPYQGAERSTTGCINGVWVAQDEEVEWTWAHTPQGSYVMGYTIRKKAPPEKFGEEERKGDKVYEV